MKFFLVFVALFGNLFTMTAAYGQSGAAERITYYAAYLAEEILGTGYTVAPGCSGSRPGGRCTFNEFLEHLWAPFEAKGDTTRPDVKLFKDNFNFNTAKLASILQSMNGYKKAGMAKPITGNIDFGRLFPGAADYYEAMRKCGSAIQPLRALYDTMGDDNARKGDAKNLIARAKESANMVIDIRGKEMDNNEIKPRITALEQALGGLTLTRKPGRDSTGRLGSYTVWDAAQSIKDHPDREADIRRAWSDWYKDPADNKSNLRHAIALISAKMMGGSCGC